jgi:DNA-binding IclR family transcriptional regulator
MSTIERVLDIFEAILNNKGEITLVELAKATDQRISTTHRICSALVKRRYLYQQGERGKYSLGYKFLLFNDVANTSGNIKTEAMPFLKELAGKISETVILSVYDGIEPIDIASILPDLVLKAVPGPDPMPSPFHCSAPGKVFLAYMPDDMKEKILSTLELTPYTEMTNTDVNRLRSELKTIVEEGIAYDDEEFLIGLRSAAAPVRGENGEVFACVSYLAPSSRVSSLKMKQFAPLVTACASSVSKALGYQDKATNR